MRMLDLEYCRILMICVAEMQIFHKDSLNQIIWEMRYVGPWASPTSVPEAGNVITEVKIVFYVVKTPTFCPASVDAYLHAF